MKKTPSLLVVFVAVGFACAPVQAGNHYYISGMGGAAWLQNVKIQNTYLSEKLH